MMGVAQSKSVCGEVFAAGENGLLSHPAIKNACVINDSL